MGGVIVSDEDVGGEW
jgi:hypothetical protein